MAAFVSYFILGVCYLQGLNIALAFGLAMAPWLLIVFVEIKWTYRHFHWFAAFSAMAFVQVIHYSQHCAFATWVWFTKGQPDLEVARQARPALTAPSQRGVGADPAPIDSSPCPTH